ncbi:MAG TPA: SIS domain-containing protein [Gemmatimonadaceae bacterium]|nr:SIS domain-containing protein [Gemmatimonadaceae bacterium]
MSERLIDALNELAATAEKTATTLAAEIDTAAQMVKQTLDRGGTLFFAGNGGSAADAQHIATEYVVRYRKTRRALRAVALTTDTSLLTAAGNDLGFNEVFARQVEALARPGDLLVVHTTSGTSSNIVRALEVADAKGVESLALTANDGGVVKALATHTIIVPTMRTDRAQEIHLCIQHAICDAVEASL